MKAMMPVIIILALVGAVVGAGMAGVVNIPGLTPQKKVAKKEDPKDAKKKEAAPVKKTKAPELPGAAPKKKDETPKPTIDPEQGAQKLASFWNEVDVKKLEDITKDWKEPDVAKVMAKMDAAKVSEWLSAMPAARASKLSKILQQNASVIPPEGA